MTEQAMEISYNRARSFLDEKSEKGYLEARNIFEQMLDYKESRKYYDLCVLELNKINIEREEAKAVIYAKALELMDKPTTAKIDSAIKRFTELDGYLDSDSKIEECKKIRINISKKDKRGINRLKAAGLFCCGIGLIVVVIVICGMIWESC